MTFGSEARRRRLGAFYTPDDIAQALVSWAVRHSTDRILDPSFGGCVFVEAALSQLQRHGCPNAVDRVFGVDIDRRALREAARLSLPPLHLRFADFLSTRPDDFPTLFSAVTGNPPFIRHQTLAASKRRIATRAITEQGYSIKGAPAYWLYFILHAISFLEKGGRLAFVLPGAFLTADYRECVHSALTQRFNDVRFIAIKGRLFSDADTETVLVLADGFDEGPCDPLVHWATSADDAIELIRDLPSSRDGISLQEHGGAWKQGLIPADALHPWTKILDSPAVHRFGTIGHIKIGAVTGANRFFVMRPSEIRAHDLKHRYFRPILQHASALPGLTITRRHIQRLDRLDRACWLLAVPSSCTSASLLAYVGSDIGLAASKAFKCRERSPWYSIRDLSVPDAFLTYVNELSPRLILNKAQALSTNAIHRVWWRTPARTKDQLLLSLSFITSLTGLAAEVWGRACGGGALKIEPGQAEKLPIALPAIDRGMIKAAFRQASQLLVNKDWLGARVLADSIVLEKGLGLATKDILSLQRAHDFLRSMRAE